MGQINWSRVVLGGLVAGLIMNVSQAIMTQPVLGTQMAAELTKHNLPPMGGTAMTFYIVMDFAVGILTLWLYAAIRPRYGAGPKTAICAALAVWFLTYFRSRSSLVVLGVFSTGVMAPAIVWGLVETILASLAGAIRQSVTPRSVFRSVGR
jgi:hypothetical protein